MEGYRPHSYRLPQENNQYPNQTDFANIVQNYLDNLSFKKQDKALIDRQRYNLILQVLQEPKNTSVSTAQFRFWVKKMFQMVSMQTGRLVICHDNKPVAVREQIYTIILWAHRQSNHGGRDKTSTLVRQRFSWIPKELIARFVRHCPFCITRRNDQSDMFSTYSSLQPNLLPQTLGYQGSAQVPIKPASLLTNRDQSSQSSSTAQYSLSVHVPTAEFDLATKTRSLLPTDETDIRNGMLPSPMTAVSDNGIHPSLSSSTSSTSSSSTSANMEKHPSSNPPTTHHHLPMYQAYPHLVSTSMTDSFPAIDYSRFMQHAPVGTYDFMNPAGPTSRSQSTSYDHGLKQMQYIRLANQPSVDLTPLF